MTSKSLGSLALAPQPPSEATPTVRRPALRTASDLKYHVEQSGHEPYFFTRETMRFFGDTMRNYGLRQPVMIETLSGEKVMAYELTRKHPVKHGLDKSAFFHAETFARVFPKS